MAAVASRNNDLARPATKTAPLPRVLYAVVMDPGQKFGSVEEQIAFLAQAFAERGSLFLPLFICSESSRPLTPLEQHGVSIECLDLERFRFKQLRRLLGLIRRHRIDVMHWNFYPPLTNGYLWWLTLLRPRLQHYFTDHNSRLLPLPEPARGFKKAVKRILLKRYARVLCVSQFVFDDLVRQNTWSNLVCCRHFINNARFEPSNEMRSQLRRQENVENRFVLLLVAHLIRDKGVDVALRGLTQLPESVVLWVVGTGPEEVALKTLARDLKLAERVRFFGSQTNVEPFMQAADCLVCPSLWAEAAGLVNLEAQACGLPVVASRIGGISEYVEDGGSGLLFPPGDAQALADCVSRLLHEPSLLRRFSQRARALVEAEFSPQARLPALLALYER